MPLTIGRWRIDRHEGAIYLQRQPNPRCRECGGEGSVDSPLTEHDRIVEPCGCWDPFRSIRIRFSRTVVTERYPF
ncbi:hypothetical protein [Streptomyces sp. NPDC096033]|uniref:hypothetical protein n=1 Tax=Streptomyces sp. NPDC096033 TaxID=3366071 RepID=UPI00382F6FE5